MVEKVLGIEISRELPTLEWEKTIRKRKCKRNFLKNSPVKVGTIEGVDLYMYRERKGGGYHYHFASFANNDLSDKDYLPVTFYCHLAYNGARNGLFRVSYGLHSVLIWRNQTADRPEDRLPSNFAAKAMHKILAKGFVREMLVSDKVKSPGGSKLFKHILYLLSLRRWSLYIGLSEGEHKYVVPVTYEEYMSKIQTIEGFGKAYRYRCVFALERDDWLDGFLANGVLVVPFNRAIRLGLFTKPHEFKDFEEVDRIEFAEYEGQKPRGW